MGSEKLLREKGIKVTRLRREVLELLLNKREPLSHTDIFKELSTEGKAPDRVTLYRVLSAFSSARLVHQIQGIDGTTRFCLHEPSRYCPGNHPHFLCRFCGRMSCLIDQPLQHVTVPEGSVVEGKQMLIFGICPVCRE